jgi:DNA (cytosine-5)-methyltransferase 1
VLSLFPGIGLLDRAFEEEGFCVVRGPDVLWGGDVRAFHPPPGVFEGVIGGPPCQAYSRLRHLLAAQGKAPRHGNLIPEFERCAAEARPDWWLMENVPEAPEPHLAGYLVRHVVLNNRWCDGGAGLGPEQHRIRRFSFGTPDGRGLPLAMAALEAPLAVHAVTGDARQVSVALLKGGVPKRTATVISGNGFGSGSAFYAGSPQKLRRRSIEDAAELQGLPRDFLAEAPFTEEGKRRAIGNGVPLPMGRAVARAVRRATGAGLTPPALAL